MDWHSLIAPVVVGLAAALVAASWARRSERRRISETAAAQEHAWVGAGLFGSKRPAPYPREQGDRGPFTFHVTVQPVPLGTRGLTWGAVVERVDGMGFGSDPSAAVDDLMERGRFRQEIVIEVVHE